MGADHPPRNKQGRLSEPSLWADAPADHALSLTEENALLIGEQLQGRMAACGLWSPDIYSGFPTTASLTPCLRSTRPTDFKSALRPARCSVNNGCAVYPSGSEIASPIRRSPTSKATIRGTSAPSSGLCSKASVSSPPGLNESDLNESAATVLSVTVAP